MKHLVLTLSCSTFLFVGLAAAQGSGTDLVIDAIVASVDGTPVTLRELGDTLRPPRKLTLEEAKADPQVRQALDGLIATRLIEAEAQTRKIKVDEADIERYIDQVAARNEMGRDDFVQALSEQGMSLEVYRKQVRQEILKSKILSQALQGTVTVTDAEINEEVGTPSSEESESDGERVQLREIAILKEGKSEEEFDAKVAEVSEALETGSDFAALARKHSEIETGRDGGLVGAVPLSHLTEAVGEVVEDLEDGEHSEAVELPDGVRFFKVDQHLEEGEAADDSSREEARRKIEARKFDERAQDFFTKELPKTHWVEKKI